MFRRTKQEGKQGQYMEELDAWIEVFIMRPLKAAWGGGRSQTAETIDIMVATVRSSIKDKMLESYRNGRMAAESSAGRSSYQRRRY